MVGITCVGGGYCDLENNTILAPVVQLNGTIYNLDQYANLSPCGMYVDSSGRTHQPIPQSVSEQGVIVTQGATQSTSVWCLLTPK